MADEHVEQPMPTPNDHPSIQSLVRTDLEHREQVGIQRYGSPLQPFNGRDALRDLYEELLDGACYARQAMEERDERQRYPMRYVIGVREDGVTEIQPVAADAELAADRDRLAAELVTMTAELAQARARLDAIEKILQHPDASLRERLQQIEDTLKGGTAGGLGSSRRAQEPGEDRRHAVAFNALTRAISATARFVALSERQAITTAVLNALDADEPQSGAVADRAIAREAQMDVAALTGYAKAIARLRDDARYRNWWTALPQQDPAYGYWQGPARQHLADYLETVGPDDGDACSPPCRQEPSPAHVWSEERKDWMPLASPVSPAGCEKARWDPSSPQHAVDALPDAGEPEADHA